MNKADYDKKWRQEHVELVQMYSAKHNPRRIKFKGKHIYVKENPRKGTCSQCKRIGRTDMHHERYDRTNPLNYTVELCGSCHSKITHKNRIK